VSCFILSIIISILTYLWSRIIGKQYIVCIGYIQSFANYRSYSQNFSGYTLPTDDKRANSFHNKNLDQLSSEDGNDARQIPATTLTVKEDYEMNAKVEVEAEAELVPGAHDPVEAIESQATPGSLVEGPAVIEYPIKSQGSKPTNPSESDKDAEADINTEAVEGGAFTSPTNE
jgi:hypothetical protein